jgi:hypothetical protein
LYKKKPKRKLSLTDLSVSEKSEEDQVFTLQNKILTDKDIQVFFQESIMNYQFVIENERCIENTQMEKVSHGNPLLRYQERLHLNRKGHQPMFKGISREKRTHLTKKIDEGPPIAHYTPIYGAVMVRPKSTKIRSEPN